MSDTASRQMLSEGAERMARDIRALVEDAESMLRHTSRQVGSEAAAAGERLERSLASAKDHLKDLPSPLLDHAREAGARADDYVRAHPWHVAGIGAGIGVLVGLLMARR